MNCTKEKCRKDNNLLSLSNMVMLLSLSNTVTLYTSVTELVEVTAKS